MVTTIPPRIVVASDITLTMYSMCCCCCAYAAAHRKELGCFKKSFVIERVILKKCSAVQCSAVLQMDVEYM